MKTIIVMLVAGLFAQQITHAQGTITYLSNLGQPSSTSDPVGSDSWLAANFRTGGNASGYVLNSIQLAMADASGSPSSFTVSIYGQANNPVAGLPGSSLGTLSGSTDPSTTGIYTYTTSGLSLAPSTHYFIVVTAGTAIANGAYSWNVADSSPPVASGWFQVNDFFVSSNGSTWNGNIGSLEYAVTATPVPEPGVLGLLALGGLGFLCYRGKTNLA